MDQLASGATTMHWVAGAQPAWVSWTKWPLSHDADIWFTTSMGLMDQLTSVDMHADTNIYYQHGSHGP